MAENLNDILNQLKGHELQPPDMLFGKIFNAVSTQNTVVQNLNGEAISVASLIDHKQTPPEYLYDRISTVLFVSSKKEGIVKPMLVLRRVAAILVLALCAWLVYYAIDSRSKTSGSPGTLVNAPAIPATPATPVTIIPQPNQPDTVENNSKTTLPASDSREFASTIRMKDKTFNKIPSKGIFKDLKIDAINLDIVDNDLLYTLFNCNYKTLAPYFESEEKKLVMGLDKYSSVTVSPKMVAFMKTMYTTNKRKKPTRKARKANTALVKWKLSDTKYFDSLRTHTPLDIIELSEFIFDKKKQ